MSSDLTVLILAAGRSTRIRDISGDLPKPLLSVGGRPILQSNLLWLRSQGVSRATINLHYQSTMIQSAVDSWGILEVQYSRERELLGTAGAWRNLPPPLGTSLIVYGDNLLSIQLAPMLEAHRVSGAGATLAYFDRERHRHTGIAGGRVFVSPTGIVSGFAEGEALASSSCVNAGVYLLERDIWDLIPAAREWDFGRQVFPDLLQRGALLTGYCLGVDDYCLGVDTPESFRRAEELMGERL